MPDGLAEEPLEERNHFAGVEQPHERCVVLGEQVGHEVRGLGGVGDDFGGVTAGQKEAILGETPRDLGADVEDEIEVEQPAEQEVAVVEHALAE